MWENKQKTALFLTSFEMASEIGDVITSIPSGFNVSVNAILGNYKCNIAIVVLSVGSHVIEEHVVNGEVLLLDVKIDNIDGRFYFNCFEYIDSINIRNSNLYWLSCLSDTEVGLLVKACYGNTQKIKWFLERLIKKVSISLYKTFLVVKYNSQKILGTSGKNGNTSRKIAKFDVTNDALSLALNMPHDSDIITLSCNEMTKTLTVTFKSDCLLDVTGDDNDIPKIRLKPFESRITSLKHDRQKRMFLLN